MHNLSTQEVIRKYVKTSGPGYKYASLASMFGGLTWEKPSFSDYQVLARYISSSFFITKKPSKMEVH